MTRLVPGETCEAQGELGLATVLENIPRPSPHCKSPNGFEKEPGELDRKGRPHSLNAARDSLGCPAKHDNRIKPLASGRWMAGFTARESRKAHGESS